MAARNAREDFPRSVFHDYWPPLISYGDEIWTSGQPTDYLAMVNAWWRLPAAAPLKQPPLSPPPTSVSIATWIQVRRV